MPQISYHSKAQVEPKLRGRLKRDLAPYTSAAAKADRLTWSLLARYEATKSSKRPAYACALLLARISNDLRCVVHLSRTAYLLQAWGIGTGLLESAYAIGHIGSDSTRADAWLTHSNLERVPWTVKEGVRSTLLFLGLPSSNEETFYRNFRILSAAKHPNPVVLTRYGVSSSDSGTKIQVDPHYTAGIAVLLRLGITYCLHAQGLALWAFHKAHLEDDALASRVLALAENTATLLASYRDLPLPDVAEGGEAVV